MYNAQFVEALKEALNGLRTIHSVGEEWCSYIGQIPTGGVPYCGQEVTRSTYSALWQYAQNQGLVKSESEWQSIYSAQGGNVPFYSSGDGSSTFRMPRLVGYVRGASGQSEAGGYVKEGLPNITANVRQVRSTAGQNASSTGALYWASLSETYPNNAVQKTDYTYGNGLLLDASLSSSVYGGSEHVTPETSVVLFGVYAFGEVSNVHALDAATLASALARVESNVANIPVPVRYVVETWKSDNSWYAKYSDGWIEQGGLLAAAATAGEHTVTLPTSFSSTLYELWVIMNCASSSNTQVQHFGHSRTATSFKYRNGQSDATWHACGY